MKKLLCVICLLVSVFFIDTASACFNRRCGGHAPAMHAPHGPAMRGPAPRAPRGPAMRAPAPRAPRGPAMRAPRAPAPRTSRAPATPTASTRSYSRCSRCV